MSRIDNAGYQWNWKAVAVFGLVLLVSLLILFWAIGSKLMVLRLAIKGVTSNDEWKPVIGEFEGVPMALVPAGCFLMGSEDGDEDESPVHKVCFYKPYWIGVTELTIGQVNESEHLRPLVEGQHDVDLLNPNFPRDTVDWFEASAFCESRGERLPTEAEWEYASRGPDGNIFPWGNKFVPEYVPFRPGKSKSFYHRVEVDSYPNDVSWVGALNMSGNLWEWTNSIYMPYPYNLADGREGDGDIDSKSPRVRRGGSWFRRDEGDFRLSNRFRPLPHRSHVDGGFRCVLPYDSGVFRFWAGLIP